MEPTHEKPSRPPFILLGVLLAMMAASAGLIVSQRYFPRGLSSGPPGRGDLTPDLRDPVAAHFANVVLVINVNYEPVAFNTTMFWRRYYSRFFRHIVVICRTAIPKLGVQAANSTYPEAPGFWKGSSWGYHYAALPRIMKQFPEADGILWTNDDVVINYWNFLGANKSRLWLPDNPKRIENTFYKVHVRNGTYRAGDWPAWPAFLKQSLQALRSLPARYQWQHWNSTKGADVYNKRVCDLFYIPRRLFPAMGDVLLPAMLDAKMMSELGIPMAFLAAEDPAEWDHVLDDMVYNWELLWGTNSSYNARDHWDPSISALHPWKVASPQGRVALLETIASVDPSVRDVFPQFFPRTLYRTFRESVTVFLDNFRALLRTP